MVLRKYDRKPITFEQKVNRTIVGGGVALALLGTIGLTAWDNGKKIFIDGIVMQPEMSTDAIRAEPSEGRNYIKVNTSNGIYTLTVNAEDPAVQNLKIGENHTFYIQDRKITDDSLIDVVPK